MQLGLTTFGETTPDPQTGAVPSTETRLAHVIEEAVHAERHGLDVYAVGEHHRPDFAVSSPATVLAAIAAQTSTIRLGSAVTVLSSDDPVRVFQQFATVDLISHGRAEIWAGRGSFVESFPLFGHDLDDYDALYREKLELLLELRKPHPTTWRGRFRAPLNNVTIQPRPVQDPLPVWIAVGGTPQSVVRAAMLGLPLVIAIIGGAPARFAPLVKLYKETAERAGHDPATMPVAINCHGFIADTTEEAIDAFYGPYADSMTRIGRERGWGPMTRTSFEQLRSPEGSLLVGTPVDVAAKIAYQQELFGMDRFLLQFSVGTIAHEKVLRSIELFGTKVAPLLRAG